MLWGSDLDGVAMLAKARHADLLADAMKRQERRQQLRQLLPAHAHEHGAWQWLRQAILGRQPQERRPESYSAHSSLQHS